MLWLPLGRKSLEADAKIVEANAVTLIASIRQAKASKFQVPWGGDVQGSCHSSSYGQGSRHHVIHAFSSCKHGDIFLNVSTIAPILDTFKVTIYSSFLAANMIIYRSLISLTGIPLIFCQALFDDNRSASSSHLGVWAS